MRTLLSAILAILLLVSCAHQRVKRYGARIEPWLNKGKQGDLVAVLGRPASCIAVGAYQRCEYRTAVERNDITPAIHSKKMGMGPDVSPYDYFDVLHLFYDSEGILRDWQPVLVQ